MSGAAKPESPVILTAEDNREGDLHSPLGAHAFALGHWGVAQKLWLGFGLLLLIMIVSSLVSLYHIRQIDRSLRQVLEIEEPLEQAILEMEINAGETARAVLDYVRELETDHLDIMQDSEADFERFAVQFERLAQTGEKRRLGREVAEHYTEFKALGDEIVALALARNSALEMFRRDVRKIYEMIDRFVQSAIDRTAPDATTKVEAALYMEINIVKAFAAIEGYMLRADSPLRREAENAEEGFERFEALYRETALSAEERGWLDRIDEDFAQAVSAGGRLMALTDSLSEGLGELEEHLEALDSALDEGIQPLIHSEKVKAADVARASTVEARVSLLVLGVMALMFGAAAAWFMSRSIMCPVRALVEGVDAVGGGSLDHKIVIKRKDEFGHLAMAFNRMVENLSHTTRALEHRAEELKRSNAELEQFAYVASHDLQEPLRKVQTFGDRLRSKYADALDEQGLDYLSRMQDAAGRMQSLIQSLLNFSRIASKAQPHVAVNLDVVAQEVVSDLEVHIQETGAKVEVADLPTIEADPTQMRQIFQNLIGNALKYRREAVAPVIQISAEVLDGVAGLANGTPDKLCRIRIEDNGIGFEPEFADRIFGIFQRLHGRGEYEGTGVGLAICRKIAEHHGGTITAQAQPGEGATFTVTLPVQRAWVAA